jgi:hypothetical protein
MQTFLPQAMPDGRIQPVSLGQREEPSCLDWPQFLEKSIDPLETKMR